MGGARWNFWDMLEPRGTSTELWNLPWPEPCGTLRMHQAPVRPPGCVGVPWHSQDVPTGPPGCDSPAGPSGHIRDSQCCPVPSGPCCDPASVLWLMTNVAVWTQPGLALLTLPDAGGAPGAAVETLRIPRCPDGCARYKGTCPGPIQAPVQDCSGPKVTSCPDLGVCELEIAPERGQGHWMSQERPQSQHSSCTGSAPASQKNPSASRGWACDGVLGFGEGLAAPPCSGLAPNPIPAPTEQPRPLEELERPPEQPLLWASISSQLSTNRAAETPGKAGDTPRTAPALGWQQIPSSTNGADAAPRTAGETPWNCRKDPQGQPLLWADISSHPSTDRAAETPGTAGETPGRAGETPWDSSKYL